MQADNLILKNPNDLIPYENNTKLHPQDQLEKIAAQIDSMGFLHPIIVDKNWVIIAGHGRRQAALMLGLKEVPVRVLDVTEEQARKFRIADNKVAESEWDEDKLRFELGALQAQDFDLKLTGFTLGEIENLFDDEEHEEEDDLSAEEEAELQEQAETQFIVAVECRSAVEMQEINEEFQRRGFDCKLVT